MTGNPILTVVEVTPWSAGLEAPTPAGSTAIVAPRTTTRLAMNVRSFRTTRPRRLRGGSIDPPKSRAPASSSPPWTGPDGVPDFVEVKRWSPA